MRHTKVSYWLDRPSRIETVYSIQVNDAYVVRFRNLDRAQKYLQKFNNQKVTFKQAPQSL